MSRPEGSSVWTELVSSHMLHLTKPQAVVLAMWSYGIARTRTCGRRTVALFLALLLKQKVGSIEQRLRDRGCGIPIAWTILIGQQKMTWRHHWLRMLRQLRPGIPTGWTVLVLADRGLYASWLFRRILRLGWHPFFRISQGAKFRPPGQARWYWLNDLVSQVRTRRRGRGTAFSSYGRRLPCTLVAWWGEGHDEPWFILTDLAPEGCDASWYALRAWCEQGFKCTKRSGWQWQHTCMTDPVRAARLWLALAVATFWMVSVGTHLEVGPAPDEQDIPDLRDILGLMTEQARHRRHRLFRLGWLWLLLQLVTDHPLPLPRRLIPEPWPCVPQLWPSPVFHASEPVYVSL